MPGCLLNIFRQIGIAVISEKITHAFAESRYGREKTYMLLLNTDMFLRKTYLLLLNTDVILKKQICFC